jgi:hypothetical protein
LGQQRRGDALQPEGQRTGFVLQAPGNLVGAPVGIIPVGFNVEMLGQALGHLRKDGAGDQDAGA